MHPPSHNWCQNIQKIYTGLPYTRLWVHLLADAEEQEYSPSMTAYEDPSNLESKLESAYEGEVETVLKSTTHVDISCPT